MTEAVNNGTLWPPGPERRRIRPSAAAYLGLGSIVLTIVVLWAAVWISKGGQTGAWQPITIFLGVYILWCVVVGRRRILVFEDLLQIEYLTRRPVQLRFDEVRASTLRYWFDGSPVQLVVHGEAPEIVVTIPLRIYAKADRDFLLSLPELRVT